MTTKIPITILCLIAATSSVAQLDSQPNSLGLYFDPDGRNNCLDRVEIYEDFVAYVIAMNTTAPIGGLEFSYDLVIDWPDPSKFVRTMNELPAGSADLGDSSDNLSGDYFFSLASPLTAGQAVVVVEWGFLLKVPMSVESYLGPSPTPSIPGGVPGMLVGDAVLCR